MRRESRRMGGSSPARRLNPTRIAVTHQDSLFVDIYRRYAPHSAYDVFSERA